MTKSDNSENLSEPNLIDEAHSLREELTRAVDFDFEIGAISLDTGVLNKMEKTKKLQFKKEQTNEGSYIGFIWKNFSRHCLCDWGDVSQEQKDNNTDSLKSGGQLFSIYVNPVHRTICILTEADRSETVIGLPGSFSTEEGGSS